MSHDGDTQALIAELRRRYTVSDRNTPERLRDELVPYRKWPNASIIAALIEVVEPLS